jgi:predicted dehydrogenase
MAVRIGFVGVGGMGQMAHLRNYVDMDGVEIAAIAEIKPKLAEKVARRYGIEKVYADHKAMLAAEKLDAVVASQPFSRHAILLPDIYPAVRCVFTEKPLAVAVEAGEKLVAAAAAAKCTHMVGYHKRSDPATAYVKGKIAEWRASGQYGRLKYVRIIMPAGDWVAAGMTGLIKSDEKVEGMEWEPPAANMDEQTRKDYVSFVNYYIHQVNLMRHMLGEPYKVTYAEKSGVLLAVESAGGVAGVIEMTPYRTTVEWEEEVLVAFEKAYVKLRLFSPLTVNRAGEAEVYIDPGDGATPMRMQPALPWVHAMRQQAMNFVKVIRGEMQPPCVAAEAVEDLRIARDYILMRRALK